MIKKIKKFIKFHFFICNSADERWGFVFVKRDRWYLDIDLGLKFVMIVLF